MPDHEYSSLHAAGRQRQQLCLWNNCTISFLWGMKSRLPVLPATSRQPCSGRDVMKKEWPRIRMEQDASY